MGVTSVDLIGRTEAEAIIGGDIRPAIRAGHIAPVKRLSEPRGAMLFDRADVEALADQIRARLEDRLRRIG